MSKKEKKAKKEKKLRKGAHLSKVQKFVMERVHRRDIKGAEYNPRQIDDHARKKLHENLKKKGLLSPLVWNKRTGNLVSGHQRLGITDDIEGTDNYQLDIAVVDLSPEQEKAQNIFFNNPSAMGTWDVDKLGEMFQADEGEERLDFKAAGFDEMDLQVIFDDTEYAETMFDLDKAPEAVKKDVATLEEIQEMKKLRKEHKQADQDENDAEFYAVVVFPDRKTQGRFMERCGLSKDDRYIDGVRLHSQLEVTKPPTKGDFVEMKFWVPKGAVKVVEGELTRIGSTLDGKNVRGRSLEFMAVTSANTPIENLMGEGAADVSSEDIVDDELARARRKKEKKLRKKERKEKKRKKDRAAG